MPSTCGPSIIESFIRTADQTLLPSFSFFNIAYISMWQESYAFVYIFVKLD